MKVSYSIMAHPDRTDHVRDMIMQLGAVPISWDEEGPASGDHDRVWRNARRAWEMHEPDADWHVLLQDDAVLCDRFVERMREACGHAPQFGKAIVSPYLGHGRVRPSRWEALAAEADLRGAGWLRTGKLMWGVAIAVPVPLIGEMIAYGDKRPGIPDDMRVAGWAARTGREVWYTWPSLVDHRPGQSLTKHKAADRVAIRHVGSATEIDFSGPVVTDPVLNLRKGPRSGPSARRRNGRSGVS